MTVYHGAKRGFEGLTLGKSNEAALINSAKLLRAKLSMTFLCVVRNEVRRSDMKRLRGRQKKTGDCRPGPQPGPGSNLLSLQGWIQLRTDIQNPLYNGSCFGYWCWTMDWYTRQ